MPTPIELALFESDPPIIDPLLTGYRASTFVATGLRPIWVISSPSSPRITVRVRPPPPTDSPNTEEYSLDTILQEADISPISSAETVPHQPVTSPTITTNPPTTSGNDDFLDEEHLRNFSIDLPAALRRVNITTATQHGYDDPLDEAHVRNFTTHIATALRRDTNTTAPQPEPHSQPESPDLTPLQISLAEEQQRLLQDVDSYGMARELALLSRPFGPNDEYEGVMAADRAAREAEQKRRRADLLRRPKEQMATIVEEVEDEDSGDGDEEIAEYEYEDNEEEEAEEGEE